MPKTLVHLCIDSEDLKTLIEGLEALPFGESRNRLYLYLIELRQEMGL